MNKEVLRKTILQNTNILNHELKTVESIFSRLDQLSDNITDKQNKKELDSIMLDINFLYNNLKDLKHLNVERGIDYL